ncbi:MAG: hypothetical protein AAGL08_07935, partial [Cyanobacteria bacterium J06573_11]
GSLVLIVQAFQESGMWGAIVAFVPLGVLFFTLSFWHRRKWVQRAGYWMLSGVVILIVLSFA